MLATSTLIVKNIVPATVNLSWVTVIVKAKHTNKTDLTATNESNVSNQSNHTWLVASNCVKTGQLPSVVVKATEGSWPVFISQ